MTTQQVNETKTKKPWYMKWWVWLIAAVIVIGGIGNAIGGSDEPEAAKEVPSETAEPVTEPKEESEPKPTPEPSPEPEPEPTPEPEPEPDVPAEFRAALNKAHTYSDLMHMSKQGIYEQLTSEYGEGFPPEAAQYAIDNMTADWNQNALNKALTYRDMMDMSNAAIYDQLVSEYGEQFTHEEAQYAVDNLP